MTADLNTPFHRWANNLRAGGLHRRRTEGTSGDRCSFIQGGSQDCGVCRRRPVVAVDQKCLADGHPRWYCSRVIEHIQECGDPERVKQMNFESAVKFVGFWLIVFLIGVAAIVISVTT